MRRAMAIPAVGRAVGLITGMVKQMPMNDYRDKDKLARPRLLQQPDPDVSRSWWVEQQITDYLMHGNAVHLVTSRDADGYPATVVWVPAAWITITRLPGGDLRYWVGGQELAPGRPDDVVHIKRGADPDAPWRGWGVVEQHLASLRRVADQERYESSVLRDSAVPSVAVITPNPDLSTTEAAEAKESWMEKFAGPKREPAILPSGTTVLPLAWSPNDTQLQEARKLGLLDVANIFNLDGYWLGAPAGSFTYRSPGPMYINLMRQTIGPIVEDFEGGWSPVWLPHGRTVKFDRQAVLGDDMSTTIGYLGSAVKNKIMTQSEAREYLGLSPELPAELKPQPVPAALAEGQDGQAGQAPADDEGTAA